MMRIKNLEMGTVRKINLGNFENVDISTTVEVELLEGTTKELRDSIVELRQELITATQDNMKAAREELGKEDLDLGEDKNEKPTNPRNRLSHK